MSEIKLIIPGQKLGTKIGFPTINLSPVKLNHQIKHGVYTCKIIFQKNKKTYSGIMHYGPRNTINDKKTSLEIHLLDFDKTVYGEKITLEIGKFLRKSKKFKNLEELKQQIKKDLMKVEQII